MVRRISPRHLFFVVLLLITGLLVPLPFVLVEPGTPDDTFGKIKGKQVLEVVGRKSFPTTGKLNLTSIWVTNPDSRLHSFELIRAWADGERSVQPREVFYPKGIDPNDVKKENVADMKNSQLSSTLAAATYLNIPYSERLVVKGATDNSPNKEAVKKEDEIISFNGKRITSSNQLRELIRTTTEKNVELQVIRDGKELTIPVQIRTVQSNGVKKNVIGILISEDYELPFNVKIRLKNIGGPSAGLILTLAIIDKLTPGALTQGKVIAGTGTIDPDGNVGDIGGIQQKLIGARDAGAVLFLAPQGNCDEVIGHIPDGLTVAAVRTLDQAMAAIETFNSGGQVNSCLK